MGSTKLITQPQTNRLVLGCWAASSDSWSGEGGTLSFIAHCRRSSLPVASQVSSEMCQSSSIKINRQMTGCSCSHCCCCCCCSCSPATATTTMWHSFCILLCSLSLSLSLLLPENRSHWNPAPHSLLPTKSRAIKLATTRIDWTSLIRTATTPCLSYTNSYIAYTISVSVLSFVFVCDDDGDMRCQEEERLRLLAGSRGKVVQCVVVFSIVVVVVAVSLVYVICKHKTKWNYLWKLWIYTRTHTWVHIYKVCAHKGLASLIKYKLCSC